MHVLNHGSRCPTSGVASARYTRGSTDDGPGVSINRYGGLSSPTCCVMVFVLLYSLARKCSSCPPPSADSRYYGRNLDFGATPRCPQPTNWLEPFTVNPAH